ncbi:MAG: alpha/beta hydrolase fold domain-containing protein [Gammaproteobacteria bacterium]|nr:alpha/beta hydrolase fold domain-containing protein [Gammaproteobacteria bacterium]
MSIEPHTEKCYKQPEFDVVIVGAGFSGIYLLHSLRSQGLSVKLFEAEDDIGGTWYQNRYPGARCDIRSTDYSYSFDPTLEAEWKWSEKVASQAEIFSYLQYVIDKYKLRQNIQLSTRVNAGQWDENNALWRVDIKHQQAQTETVTCRFFVMASGCLSVPKVPDIPGVNRFSGESYHTSNWPKEPVSFDKKRVAVIGTGSSGIQIIPEIAAKADELTVFQRTPCFSLPANNHPISPDTPKTSASERETYHAAARMSPIGVAVKGNDVGALEVSEKKRHMLYEHLWSNAGIAEAASVFNDLGINRAANETLAEFIRQKIRATVADPAVAEMLCPKDYAVFTKRLCFDTHYYQTYNLSHVRLVNLKKEPILSITEQGIDTVSQSFLFDMIVYAVGFDAMTGALLAVDIVGRNGVQLRNKWSDGPQSYLGLMTAGFPNLFMVTGPGSPSVMTNMLKSIEQHVEWISGCIQYMSKEQFTDIEPTKTAELAWTQHVDDWGNLTLFPEAASWYTGSNVPGKPRVFMPYAGGLGNYRITCDEVVSRDYLGFSFKGVGKTQCHDGVIRGLKPDVAMMLEAANQVEGPRPETLPVKETRALYASIMATQPPGPEVQEVLEGQLPGLDDADLAYRLYRPAGNGPHPVVVYFHGGGWVLGNLNSDDAFCRDLCVRSESIIVSIDYRLAPEYAFPTAINDGFAAVQWVAKHAASLGGLPGQMAVAGFSAGANIATVVCHLARDLGGPHICGQLLVNPMIDCDFSRSSYQQYAEGYLLTTPLIHWFWNHYANEENRQDSKASPIRAKSLANLPPALITTSEFDPLSDEGAAYAAALKQAGVSVSYHSYHGHIHGSLVAVDAFPSSVTSRIDMASALTHFFTCSKHTKSSVEKQGIQQVETIGE